MSIDTQNNSMSPPLQAEAPLRSVAWERETLEKLAFATLAEQRARRRWNIFFRFVFVALILIGAALALGYTGGDMEAVGTHSALIEIDGTIESGGGSGSAESVIPALNRAFADASTVGVILRINSPGGSPVQAGIISDEMQRLRKAYPQKPLYVVVDEMCASGGYYIAAAADRIYVNKASIVGSIGVLMDGFGFTGLMEKLGVERRLMTGGENKGFLDPFSPQTDKHRVFAQAMLDQVHRQFIDVVKAGRGKRLKDSPELFTGLFWTGQQAVEIGLADQLGNLDFVAREIVKAEDLVDYTRRDNVAERLAKKFGAAIGEGAIRALKAVPAIR
jgi:protease-4